MIYLFGSERVRMYQMTTFHPGPNWKHLQTNNSKLAEMAEFVPDN